MNERRMVIDLPTETYEALKRLAEAETRSVRQQATMVLRIALAEHPKRLSGRRFLEAHHG